jgi:hypothetical protein
MILVSAGHVGLQQTNNYLCSALQRPNNICLSTMSLYGNLVRVEALSTQHQTLRMRPTTE